MSLIAKIQKESLLQNKLQAQLAEMSYRVYQRAFLRCLTSYFFTNTHGKVVVVRQNVCGVPVWT
jgi:hypothetical protein